MVFLCSNLNPSNIKFLCKSKYQNTFAVLSGDPVGNCLSLDEAVRLFTSLSCVFNVNKDEGFSDSLIILLSNIKYSNDHTLTVVSWVSDTL